MRNTASALASALITAVLGGCAASVDVARPGLHIAPSMSIRHTVTPQGYFEIGRYLQAQGRYVNAADAYRKCIQLDPNRIEAHNGLGIVLALTGSHDAAIASFGNALSISPSAQHLWSNLGYAYYIAGNHDAARAVLAYSYTIDPTNPNAIELLARVGRAATPTTIAAEKNEMPIASTAISMGIEAAWQLIEAPLTQYVTIDRHSYALPSSYSAHVTSGENSNSTAISHPTLEISNGNGVRGLAQRISRSLDERGVPVTRLTNQKGFAVRETELQYRPGHEKDAAIILAALPKGVSLRQAAQLRKDIDIRLVLGKDITNNFARKYTRTGIRPNNQSS